MILYPLSETDMRSIRRLLATAVLVFYSASSQASMICEQGMGQTHCREGDIPSLNTVGYALLEGTRIAGELRVTGPSKVYGAHLHECQITGPTEISHSEILGEFHLDGVAELEQVTFEGPVEITGVVECYECVINAPMKLSGLLKCQHSEVTHQMTLNVEEALLVGSTTKDILVINDRASSARLNLEDTVVIGDIEFIGEPGEVALVGESKIVGTLINGKILQIEHNA